MGTPPELEIELDALGCPELGGRLSSSSFSFCSSAVVDHAGACRADGAGRGRGRPARVEPVEHDDRGRAADGQVDPLALGEPRPGEARGRAREEEEAGLRREMGDKLLAGRRRLEVGRGEVTVR